MKLTHGSLFAGVEGFGLGFQQAGYETIWQVEREPYCIAVLKTRFPNVERYYDIKDCGIGRKHKLGAVDVVTAGFPCQDLSVAGKRAGLAGARSGLFWEVIRIMGELRPNWLVLENVPGLFSSNNGRDFALLLSALGELRLFQSIAWTVLDSQYFGVAQRRRRVFIVCGPGVGSSEQVLFERKGCEGDFAQSGEERPDIAGTLAVGAHASGFNGQDAYRGNIIANAISASHHGHSSPRGDGSDNLVTVGTLQAEEGGSAWGANQRVDAGHIIPVAIALRKDPGGIGQGWNTNFVAAPITASYGKQLDSSDSNSGPPNAIISAPADAHRMRNTPRLSEGLDDTRFSLLPEGIDSPRYRALGNAVTVSVARYLAERIKAVAEE